MRADLLHVVAVYANPMRWQARLRNFLAVERHMLASGVNLTTVECAYGDRDFELTDHGDAINRVRVRAQSVLWHKENLIDIGFAGIGDWTYGAWVDGDTLFMHPNWAAETVQMLQLHKIVQISSDLVFLGPKHEHLGRTGSLVQLFSQAPAIDTAAGVTTGYLHEAPQRKIDRHGYPGLAWAYRRDAFDHLGGLIDYCIVGAADHHMATALLGLDDALLRSAGGYAAKVQAWRARAAHFIAGDIGLVPGTAAHLWHGNTANRKYPSRWQILTDNAYEPETDIVYDRQGLVQLAGNKPKLRDDLRAYFLQRNEDDVRVD